MSKDNLKTVQAMAMLAGLGLLPSEPEAKPHVPSEEYLKIKEAQRLRKVAARNRRIERLKKRGQ